MKRRQNKMTIEKRISKARSDFLLDFPWFGALSMNLKIEQSENIPTFDVDGTRMRYNPTFAASLNNRELSGVIAHEVMHCALLHIYRRNNRDPFMWNVAADYAINQELINSGLTLPKGCLLDSKYAGLPAEVIYAQLRKQQQQQQKQSQQGQGNGQGQPTGTFSDPPPSEPTQDGQQSPTGQPEAKNGQQKAPQDMSERDWKIAAEQATKVAKAAGKLPADIERMITCSRESKVDWKQELREFLAQTTPSDYSWQTPNRRYVAQNIYLPGMVKEGFGRLAIAVDTSGSIGQRELNAFASELTTICSDLKPEQVTVIYCDAHVQHVQEIPADEDVKLEPKCGGGTYFQPV